MIAVTIILIGIIVIIYLVKPLFKHSQYCMTCDSYCENYEQMKAYHGCCNCLHTAKCYTCDIVFKQRELKK